MIKCLAFICLLGLTVSAWEFDNKRSNRMNLLSKTVGARMLAGTNDGFQMADNGNQQFVPIQRTVQPAINNMADNGQLTPDQLQQLHQFISSQSVGQQQPVSQQFQPQQPTQQQQFQPPVQTQQKFAPQQQQQPQQTFRMDSFNQNPNPNPMTFDNTQQFGRMTVTTTSTTTTTTPSPIMQASKPSAMEQQLLDQQVRIQQMKDQLFNLQQQQQRMTTQQQVPTQTPQQQQPVPTQQAQPTILQQQQLQQQQQQQQQFVQQQQKVQQQQQMQQQQLLDQIAQQQQLNQKPVPGQQQTFQKVPQMQVAQVAQPTMNVSRIATQVRPQQPVFQQQQPIAPQQQQRGRSNDICAGAKPGDKIPHPIEETQYVVCGELGEIFLMDCPQHTVFNPHLGLCDLTTDLPILCKSNPCLNGAKCVELSATQFQCECPLGFSGKTCEKFDTCSSSQPCGQDGVCLSFALGSPIPHVCLCNGGRSVGMTCAQSEQNPCLVQGSSTKLMPVNFNRAVFAHCEGARPHFKFCQPPLMFSPTKQACEWTI